MKYFSKFLLLIVMISVSTLLPSLRAADAAAPQFHAMLDAYYEEYVALFPIDAVVNGDTDSRYENIWPDDASPGYRAKVVALCDRYLGELGKYDRASLTPSDQLSYDIL